MAKKEGFTQESVPSNKNLSSFKNGVLNVVSVSSSTFKKVACKARDLNDIGKLENYVSACFKKKAYIAKCQKCQDVGHFSVNAQTPNGEYTFAVVCSECQTFNTSLMHSAEYERNTGVVLSNKETV